MPLVSHHVDEIARNYCLTNRHECRRLIGCPIELLYLTTANNLPSQRLLGTLAQHFLATSLNNRHLEHEHAALRAIVAFLSGLLR